jgi:hypothetical protein
MPMFVLDVPIPRIAIGFGSCGMPAMADIPDAKRLL